MEEVVLTKTVYSKVDYPRIIDTNFTQLINQQEETQSPPEVSVEEFFTNYREIFFNIPKLGESNSHEYLMKTSGDYISDELVDPTIQALLEEINNLRQENLELNQTIIDLTNQQG
jgi:hypothetical protein